MSTPTVHVLACGGTIASTPGDDGAAPTLTGDELIATVPGLESLATITVEEVARTPGFDVARSTVAEVGRLAEAATADAVVVTHGTDTIEETAYHLDLALSVPTPIVVTGSQRRLDEPSSDAPANLLAAVRAATDDRLRNAGGVYVAFNDELHAARDVTKAHTSALETFESPGKGPVATLTRETIRFHREPGSRSASIPALESTAYVPVVSTGQGVDATTFSAVVDAGADGVVVAGTGLGNVTASLGEAIVGVADEVPVVVTSRCHAGAVEAVYGTPGGAVTLRRAGVIDGDDLPAWKARVKLALVCSVADDVDEVRRYFEGVPGRH